MFKTKFGYLLDTSVWIHNFAKMESQTSFRCQKFIKNHLDRLFTCELVIAEFAQGLKNDQLIYLEPLESVGFLESSFRIGKLTGHLANNLKNKGQMVPISDCLLVAYVICYRLVLVSTDNHFKRFTDLQLKLL